MSDKRCPKCGGVLQYGTVKSWKDGGGHEVVGAEYYCTRLLCNHSESARLPLKARSVRRKQGFHY